MTAIVAERGQVTIPRILRERMGIVPATVLTFSIRNGELIARKEIEQDPVAAVRGCLKITKTSDELVSEMRGEL